MWKIPVKRGRTGPGSQKKAGCPSESADGTVRIYFDLDPVPPLTGIFPQLKGFPSTGRNKSRSNFRRVTNWVHRYQIPQGGNNSVPPPPTSRR